MSRASVRIRDVMVQAKHVLASQSLQSALDFMEDNHFDQAPVLDLDGGQFVGVVSHRFLSEDRVSARFGPMPNRPVRESMRQRDRLPPEMVRVGGDDVIDSDVMNFLYKHDYVLIEKAEGPLCIASTWDVANGLLQRW